jgi:hypothetical protein
MTVDEQQIRQRLAVIVADVQFTPDSQAIRARGHRIRRRRRVAATVSALIVIAVGVALPVLLLGGNSPSKLRITPGGTKVAPLADLGATPTGWSPIGYQNAQISVPSAWLIQNPGTDCGQHDAGHVFIAENPSLPSGVGCGAATNNIVLRSPASTPVPHGRAETVNGIRVEIGSSQRGGQTTYLERGLGLDISATGPLARAVLRTLTHSPLSVVLHSANASAPATWRRVSFGGLRFAVPSTWRTVHYSGWGGCPYNFQPNLLELSTAQTFAAPGCPPPPDTAGYDAGVESMVVGAGPEITDQHLAGERCRTRNSLKVCIDPPPLHGGYPQGRGLQILTALVYLPHQHRPDQIEIGLSGSGLIPAQIFDSLTPIK